ncbi:MAG: alpha/beta fold hydrolase [Thermoanaerobaculia bacterium]
MTHFANSCAAIFVACLGITGGVGSAWAADARPPAEVKVVRAGGVELHYIERGSGVPVVFVHGSVDDYRSFEPQLEPLSKHYRVISYSRRYNFPNAATALSGNHSALVEADDLANLLKALGAYPAHVVGHSYGAYTADPGDETSGARSQRGPRGAAIASMAARTPGRTAALCGFHGKHVESGRPRISNWSLRGGLSNHNRLVRQERLCHRWQAGSV